MLLIWWTGIIFQIRNWLYCLTAFEIHHHFIMRCHFSLDVLCVKEHEHWYSGISSEFIMHNTRVIGLQIASKETWKRSPYCIFGVIGDVKCTWSDPKKNVHHVQRKSLKISEERWIFCLTAFDYSMLGYSNNNQVSGPVEFENFINSIHVFMSAVGIVVRRCKSVLR